MAFVPYRCILKGRLFGTVATRNMFCAEIEAVAPEVPGDWFYQYLQNIYNHIQTYISTGWTVESFEVQYLLGTKWITTDEIAWSYGGTGAGEVLPNAVAGVLIGKALGLRKLGRKFISGILESATSTNTFVSAALTAFGLALVDYISPLTLVGGTVGYPGVMDKEFQFQRFMGGFVSSLLGSMRRRKPGLGI